MKIVEETKVVYSLELNETDLHIIGCISNLLRERTLLSTNDEAFLRGMVAGLIHTGSKEKNSIQLQVELYMWLLSLIQISGPKSEQWIKEMLIEQLQKIYTK